MNTQNSHGPLSSHPWHAKRWKQGGALANTLATVGVATSVVLGSLVALQNCKPSGPKSILNQPSNMADGIDYHIYDNNLDQITKQWLINAARVRNTSWDSADAQAFDGLWTYLQKSGMYDKGWIKTKIHGHGIVKNVIVEKWDWTKWGKKETKDDAHYDLEAFTDWNERIIIYTWNQPDNPKEAADNPETIFRGFREFRQYDKNGAIRMYESDKTWKRIWPNTIGKEEFIGKLRDLPGLKES